MRIKQSDITRFMNKFNKSENCWEWTAFKSSFGHGQMSLGGRKGKPEAAHRISYMIYIGSIPKNMCVCHKCDNPSCVNPAHLFLGTQADNVKDMDNKGRRVNTPQLGIKHGCAKLTEEEVLAARYMIKVGFTYKTTGEFLGVTPTAIHYVVNKGWRHL